MSPLPVRKDSGGKARVELCVYLYIVEINLWAAIIHLMPKNALLHFHRHLASYIDILVPAVFILLPVGSFF